MKQIEFLITYIGVTSVYIFNIIIEQKLLLLTDLFGLIEFAPDW